jgi:signal transduction histidine kinase
MIPLLSLTLERRDAGVAAGRCATRVAALLDLDAARAKRMVAAVLQIASNVSRRATGGSVHFELDAGATPQRLRVRIEHRGPAVAGLADVLTARDAPAACNEIGLPSDERVVDRFAIESTPEATRLVLEMSRSVEAPSITTEQIQEIAGALRAEPRLAPVDDQPLDPTDGDDSALQAWHAARHHVRRADAPTARFLSNMTHEFRTPVNAIIGLCNLLHDERVRHNREIEPELHYIRDAAGQLSTLVDDLLDLARIDAGKSVVRAAPFHVQTLFGVLRGMLCPLLLSRPVALVFEDAAHLPPIHSDEAKISQILRNLISNGLKFTEAGEVRVSAAIDAAARTITFRVADTGIGIAAAHHDTIFEEFEQIEHPLQLHVRGTGLGLPLSRRLAQLLGGSLGVVSEPGAGSAFSVVLPWTYAPRAVASDNDNPSYAPEPAVADGQTASDRTSKRGRVPSVAADGYVVGRHGSAC